MIMITDDQAKEIRALEDLYQQKAKEIGFKCGLIPDVLRPYLPTNEQKSDLELYEYVHNPLSVGDKYGMYVDKETKTVTNWTGKELGRITFMGNYYRSGLGHKRRNIRIKDVNGANLFGYWYYEYQDFISVKRIKD